MWHELRIDDHRHGPAAREQQGAPINRERPLPTRGEPSPWQHRCDADEKHRKSDREEHAPKRCAVGLEAEDGRQRSKREIGQREEREPGGQDQLVEESGVPKAAEHQDGGGQSGDRGSRLERYVKRRRVVLEIEVRNEDEGDGRAGGAERAANHKPT